MSPCRLYCFVGEKLNGGNLVSLPIKEKLDVCRTPATVTRREEGGKWIVVSHGNQKSTSKASSLNY
jgi:hypothetical protein